MNYLLKFFRVDLIRLSPDPILSRHNAGWSKEVTADGHVYHKNHQTTTTSSDRPTTQETTVPPAVPAPGRLGNNSRMEEIVASCDLLRGWPQNMQQ